MTTKTLRTACAMTICCVLLIAGCKIGRQTSDDDKKVSIEAPGASVKVDTGGFANDSGIPLYPGAQELRSSGGDKGRAHVNLDMPFLKVRVVALKFTSGDAPEKIVAFYRDKLDSYGTVLECKGKCKDVDIGSGRGMNSPVTCGKQHGNPDEISLKVGTESNQHLVSVKPSGKGSEFELVYIRLGNEKNEDDYSGKQPS